MIGKKFITRRFEKVTIIDETGADPDRPLIGEFEDGRLQRYQQPSGPTSSRTMFALRPGDGPTDDDIVREAPVETIAFHTVRAGTGIAPVQFGNLAKETIEDAISLARPDLDADIGSHIWTGVAKVTTVDGKLTGLELVYSK